MFLKEVKRKKNVGSVSLIRVKEAVHSIGAGVVQRTRLADAGVDEEEV